MIAHDKTRDWSWEGNVVVSLATFLMDHGWAIDSTADTATKEHGVDLLASKEVRTLAIEVKGYPSEGYADPKRAGEKKRTRPTNQAPKWYAQALLQAMKWRSSMPDAEIAVAFPDFPRYRAFLQETEDSLRLLGIGVYLVNGWDEATMLIPHARRRRKPVQDLLPFDGYEGGGRTLLGVPAFGGGSSRRDYGVPVFEQCGWACAYCGVEMEESYTSWLSISVDHVIPQSLIQSAGYSKAWIEDLTNKVTCCRHCNEFLNQFRVTEPPPDSLEEFFDLRDRVFRAKREAAIQRHARERQWYASWQADRR